MSRVRGASLAPAVTVAALIRQGFGRSTNLAPHPSEFGGIMRKLAKGVSIVFVSGVSVMCLSLIHI